MNNQNTLNSLLQANKDTLYNESNISINEDKSYCTSISLNSGNSILSHSFHHTNDINHEIKLLKLMTLGPLYTPMKKSCNGLMNPIALVTDSIQKTKNIKQLLTVLKSSTNSQFAVLSRCQYHYMEIMQKSMWLFLM